MRKVTERERVRDRRERDRQRETDRDRDRETETERQGERGGRELVINTKQMMVQTWFKKTTDMTDVWKPVKVLSLSVLLLFSIEGM